MFTIDPARNYQKRPTVVRTLNTELLPYYPGKQHGEPIPRDPNANAEHNERHEPHSLLG
jgi:hypothetical protein